MRKMLIVGLGGSGGKTVAFLMDELKVRLGEQWGKDRLPECWQFAHVDVPSMPDTVGANLASSVDQQGGHYIGLTDANTSYGKLDAVFANSLAANNNLGYFARWRPDAGEASKIPIAAGAGAVRAVGRVVTLSSSTKIYNGLKSAVEKLNSQQAREDLNWVQTSFMKSASADSNAQTLVFIVSSVSGGSGASMVMDVADLLRGMQDAQLDGEHTTAFLYTPEVFGNLVSQPGAGALATVSELLAALNRGDEEWDKEEWRIVSGGGAPIPTSTGRGPLNIIPVGAKSHGVPFGNSPEDVYRGFSRMLAPLYTDKSVQNDFVAYSHTNARNLAKKNPDNSSLLTKVGPNMFVSPTRNFSHFSAWGSATLTLGHDRYTEYAAQRIAREAAEILANYQVLHADGQPPAQAVAAFAKQAFPTFEQMVPVGMTNGSIITKDLGAQAFNVNALTAAVNSQVSVYTQVMNGVVSALGQALGLQASKSAMAHESALKSLIIDNLENWVHSLQVKVEEASLRVAADYGLMVAEQVLLMFQQSVVQYASTNGGKSIPIAGTLKSDLNNAFNKGLTGVPASATVLPGSSISTNLGQVISDTLKGFAMSFAMPIIVDTLNELVTEYIPELAKQLQKTREELESRLKTKTSSAGMSAAFRKADISSWPSPANPIPSHFEPALNEVMVNKVAEFDSRFQSHINAAISTSGVNPISEAAKQVITRKMLAVDGSSGFTDIVGWKLQYTATGSHPHIGRTINWLPSMLASQIPGKNASKPKFEKFALNDQSLLSYARSWVDIPGSSFRRFTEAGFRSWLNESVGEGTNRDLDFVAAMNSALDFATPLVDIDEKLVQAIHGPSSFGYQYWISAIPIAKSNPILDQIKKFWSMNASGRDFNDNKLESACQPSTDPKEIHISSTMAAPYSAAVFKSLTAPIRQDWETACNTGTRQDFWEWRRSRPLREFVPVSAEWRQAFLQGWLIGRITGLIQNEPLDDGSGRVQIKVYDNSGGVSRWQQFPHDLLGVAELGVAMAADGLDESGWNIPAALLESLPLAMATCRGDLGEPLAPLAPYISVLKLGLTLKITPKHKNQPVGAKRNVISPLDRWFKGESASQFAPQVTAARAETPEKRRESVSKWLEEVLEYLDKSIDVPILDGQKGNFRKINRVYEIAGDLRLATQAVLDELQRPALGQADEPDQLIDADVETFEESQQATSLMPEA